MKRAIVLSGGGSKGAYEIGFWKALRKLGISYDIVTGTSIGALNGAFMTMNDYPEAIRLWYFVNYNNIIDEDISDTYADPSGRRKIIKTYVKGALTGGMSVVSMENTIEEYLDVDKFFSSPIDYGLVTVSFPSLKPITMTKKDLTKENIKDYLIASASCFPAFKIKQIDNNKFIDGGYYDNLPINLAIDMGADEVIAVDLRAVGNTKSVKNKNVPITMIMPRNDIGNFLVIEKDYARRAMRFGYNDTLKTYGKLEGNLYTFKKGSLSRNYNRNGIKFQTLLNTYSNGLVGKIAFKKMLLENYEKDFNEVLENTAKAFDVDESKIYRTSVINILIKKKYSHSSDVSLASIKKDIKNNKLGKNVVSKELILYIYNELNNNKRKSILELAQLFPKSFLSALYLLTIER